MSTISHTTEKRVRCTPHFWATTCPPVEISNAGGGKSLKDEGNETMTNCHGLKTPAASLFAHIRNSYRYTASRIFLGSGLDDSQPNISSNWLNQACDLTRSPRPSFPMTYFVNRHFAPRRGHFGRCNDPFGRRFLPLSFRNDPLGPRNRHLSLRNEHLSHRNRHLGLRTHRFGHFTCRFAPLP